jgi:hypothetical protein
MCLSCTVAPTCFFDVSSFPARHGSVASRDVCFEGEALATATVEISPASFAEDELNAARLLVIAKELVTCNVRVGVGARDVYLETETNSEFTHLTVSAPPNPLDQSSDPAQARQIHRYASASADKELQIPIPGATKRR